MFSPGTESLMEGRDERGEEGGEKIESVVGFSEPQVPYNMQAFTNSGELCRRDCAKTEA